MIYTSLRLATMISRAAAAARASGGADELAGCLLLPRVLRRVWEARPRSALILVPPRSGLTPACAQIVYMGKVEASRDACDG